MCGSEPNFTNYAQAKDQEPFIDCLDYIFISQECRALGVKKLPHRSEVQGPLPTLDEPSDHILIASTISIPPLSPKQERKP